MKRTRDGNVRSSLPCDSTRERVLRALQLLVNPPFYYAIKHHSTDRLLVLHASLQAEADAVAASKE